MPVLDLDDIEKLALNTSLKVDDRPDWLRQLPFASDAGSLYYLFFHNLVRDRGPLSVVEVGSYIGVGSAHLSYANRGGNVVTVDIDPAAKSHIEAMRLTNTLCLTGDSLDLICRLESLAPFDICFIDATHQYERALREFEEYRRLLRSGGLVFFDDISLKRGDEDMTPLWDHLPEPKRRLDFLHATGFGVVQVEEMR